MNKSDGVQLLIGTVILGALGFLGTNIFEMKGTLSSIQERSQATESRVSRIANVLPDIGVRIASEEVNKRISGFMALGSREEEIAGTLYTRVALYNSKGQNLKVFNVKSAENIENAIPYYLMGLARADQQNDSTFAELVAYSSDLENYVTAPQSIDTRMSLVFDDMEPEEMEAHIRNLGAQEIENVDFGYIENWRSLSLRLSELESVASFAE